MDMVKAGIRSCESAKGSNSVTLYFDTLTRKAGFGPLAEILIDARPDKAFRD